MPADVKFVGPGWSGSPSLKDLPAFRDQDAGRLTFVAQRWSALWMADALFEYANVGVDGLNIQTSSGDAYAPFTFNIQNAAYSVQSIRPEHYGVLLFQESGPANARLLPVHLSTSANLIRLRAPSFDAKSGITLGGVTFDGSQDGAPLGTTSVEVVQPTGGRTRPSCRQSVEHC